MLEFCNSTAARLVSELRDAIVGECDLSRDRANLEAFGAWLASSPSVRLAGLSGAVAVPETAKEKKYRKTIDELAAE